MRKGIIFIISLWLLQFQPKAQSLNTANSFSTAKKDTLYFSKPRLFQTLGHFPSNMLGIAKTPFKGDNWLSLLAIAQGTAVLITQDQHVTDWVKKASLDIGLNPETKYKNIVKFGKTSIIKIPLNLNAALYQLGEGGTSLMLAGGLWIYGKFKHDWRAEQTAYDLGETFISMGISIQILKRISGRESPFKATAPGGRWRPFPSFNNYRNNTSSCDAFPSGHLATMMATVTVLKENYPEKKWIGPLGYSLISLTGWAMVNTEVHWFSDYPLALAIGYLSGKLTTMRHKKPHPKTKMIIL
jgi:hypothetical protein